MFDDLNQIDWKALGNEQAPQWIRGLGSENQVLRNESFDALINSYIYERLDLASLVVPFILRILEHQESNSETELLIVFLKNIYINANEFLHQGIAVESSKKIVADINNSIGAIRSLSDNLLVRDAALELIFEIEKNDARE